LDVTADMRNAVKGMRMTTFASPVLRLAWSDTKKSRLGQLVIWDKNREGYARRVGSTEVPALSQTGFHNRK